MHGHNRGSRVGMASMMVRMLLPRPPLAMLRFRVFSSAFSSSVSVAKGGILEASRQNSSFLLSSWKRSVFWRYFSIFCWNSRPLKARSCGFWSMTETMSWW